MFVAIQGREDNNKTCIKGWITFYSYLLEVRDIKELYINKLNRLLKHIFPLGFFDSKNQINLMIIHKKKSSQIKKKIV